mmetsp:Transcript_48042/g.121107  ORF Transcript_48042/g.121107 Transcript_48042/m.121107 type:complete len:206 (+) Transcript_48042:229-846(+)
MSWSRDSPRFNRSSMDCITVPLTSSKSFSILVSLSASAGFWNLVKSSSTSGQDSAMSPVASSHLPVMRSRKMRTDSESSENATLCGYSASMRTAAESPCGCVHEMSWPRFWSICTLDLLPNGVLLAINRLWNRMCSLIGPRWKKLKLESSEQNINSMELSSFHLYSVRESSFMATGARQAGGESSLATPTIRGYGIRRKADTPDS